MQQPLFRVTIPQVKLSVSWLGVLDASPLLALLQVGIGCRGFQSSSLLNKRIKAASHQDEYISLHYFNKFIA